jgi:hypothetical protein
MHPSDPKALPTVTPDSVETGAATNLQSEGDEYTGRGHGATVESVVESKREDCNARAAAPDRAEETQVLQHAAGRVPAKR